MIYAHCHFLINSPKNNTESHQQGCSTTISPISHSLKPSSTAKTALTLQHVEPLEVSCSIWLQGAGSRDLGSMGWEVSVDWPCSSTYQKCTVRYAECECWVSTKRFLGSYLSRVLLGESAAVGECCHHLWGCTRSATVSKWVIHDVTCTGSKFHKTWTLSITFVYAYLCNLLLSARA